MKQCEYINCCLNGWRVVEGKLLCATHGREYEEYLSLLKKQKKKVARRRGAKRKV